MKISIDVVSGPEGVALYVNDYRMTGPKPWGGGRVLHSFMVEADEVKQIIDKQKLIRCELVETGK